MSCACHTSASQVMDIWPDIDGTYVIATWVDDQIRRIGPFPYVDVSIESVLSVCVCVCLCVRACVRACDCLTIF